MNGLKKTYSFGIRSGYQFRCDRGFICEQLYTITFLQLIYYRKQFIIESIQKLFVLCSTVLGQCKLPNYIIQHHTIHHTPYTITSYHTPCAITTYMLHLYTLHILSTTLVSLGYRNNQHVQNCSYSNSQHVRISQTKFFSKSKCYMKL